jgi:hypothetical protein
MVILQMKRIVFAGAAIAALGSGCATEGPTAEDKAEWLAKSGCPYGLFPSLVRDECVPHVVYMHERGADELPLVMA